MAEPIQFPSASVILGFDPDTVTDPSPAAATAHNPRRLSAAVAPGAATGRRRSSQLAASNIAGVDKPKQKKSRGGCQTCKRKRLKCDEGKPKCAVCLNRNIDCEGYKKNFKWRAFEDSNVKFNIDRQNQLHGQRQQRAKSPQPRPVDAQVDCSGQTTPQNEFPTPDNIDGHSALTSKRNSIIRWEDTAATSRPPERPAVARRATQSPDVDMSSPSPPDTVVRQSNTPVRALPTTNPEVVAGMTLFGDLQPGRATRMSQARATSPTLTEILAPFNSTQSPHGDVDMMAFHSPGAMLGSGFADHEPLEHDLNEALQTLHPPQALPRGHSRRRSSPVPDPSGMQDLDMQDLVIRSRDFRLYTPPHMSDMSIDALSWRFLNVTCGFLSVMDGPDENPWRTLIWPLALQSPALHNALAALAAFHAAFEMPQMRVVGHEHKQASLQFLQERLQAGDMHDEIAIATALALGFAEAWDLHTVSGNTHIKGAQVLVKHALAEHRRQPLQGDALKLLKFLCNAWVYMDVIARLTAVDNDESNDFDNALFLPQPPNMVMGDDGFGIDFGMPIDARLDPFMGCANTLFPLIGRVGNLVRRVCRSVNNSASVISQARDLKRALEEWEPPAAVDEPDDPDTDVEHTVQTAEAYRWATLLHLHQSVPELPSPPSAELAQRVLQYLATVPPESRTLNVHIYPLLVAGCEASVAEDRQWVRGRWERMSDRMHLGTLEKAATVTEEVWRRRDAYEAQPTSRRKLVATADLQPVRRNGSPLVRTDTGSWGGDPGRTGVVFSYVADGTASVEGNSPDGGGGIAHAPAPHCPIHSNKAIGMLGDPQNPNNPDKQSGQRRSRHERIMDPAYTVRGHLHWVGVMWNWGWEVLLG